MVPKTPIVFVVDDDVSVREALEALIGFEGWQVETYSSAEEFLLRQRFHGPSCLVLDVSLPDLNGLDLQTRVAADRADMPIIFITGHGDVPMSVRAMKAGAVDFLQKPVDDQRIIDAVQGALAGAARRWEARVERMSITALVDTLTPREREVLSLIVTGLPNKLVADQLGAAEKTIKVHRARVMEKMKASSLAELVVMVRLIGIGGDAKPGETSPPPGQ